MSRSIDTRESKDLVKSTPRSASSISVLSERKHMELQRRMTTIIVMFTIVLTLVIVSALLAVYAAFQGPERFSDLVKDEESNYNSWVDFTYFAILACIPAFLYYAWVPMNPCWRCSKTRADSDFAATTRASSGSTRRPRHAKKNTASVGTVGLAEQLQRKAGSYSTDDNNKATTPANKMLRDSDSKQTAFPSNSVRSGGSTGTGSGLYPNLDVMTAASVRSGSSLPPSSGPSGFAVVEGIASVTKTPPKERALNV